MTEAFAILKNEIIDDPNIYSKEKFGPKQI